MNLYNKDLVEMTCTGCGDILFPSKDVPGFWECGSCGKYHAKDKSGNYFAVEISNPVEVFKGDAERERMVRNAEQFLALGEYGRAKTEYENIVNTFPDDYRGWLGLYKLPIVKYFDGQDFCSPDEKNLSNALRLNREETLRFFDYTMSKYGNELRLKPYKKYIVRDLSFNSLESSTIDEYTEWMLFVGLNAFLEIKYQPFTKFLYRLSKSYYNLCTDGKLVPYHTTKMPCNINVQDWKYDMTNTTNELITLFDCFGCKIKINNQSGDITVSSPTYRKNSITLFSDRKYHDFIIVGKWLFYYMRYSREFILLPRALQLADLRRFSGLCPYCGSRFKGLLSKVCSNQNCRHPKDY